MRKFKEDIFIENKPTIQTVKKYLNFTDKVETTNNRAYRNSTCEGVSATVRKMLNKTTDFEVGEVLVCRKYLELKGGKCSVNFE